MHGEHGTPWLVVLAAGAGSRILAHGSKLALPVHGRPLLAWTLELVGRAMSPAETIVVIAPDSELEAIATGGGAMPVVAQDASLGMAYSLRAGLAAVAADAPGAIVVLGDDPLALCALGDVRAAAAERPDECVAVRRAGGTPHPVYVPRDLWPSRVRDEDADNGLRHLLGDAHWIESDGPEPIDADTRDDLARLADALAGDDTQ